MNIFIAGVDGLMNQSNSSQSALMVRLNIVYLYRTRQAEEAARPFNPKIVAWSGQYENIEGETMASSSATQRTVIGRIDERAICISYRGMPCACGLNYG